MSDLILVQEVDGPKNLRRKFSGTFTKRIEFCEPATIEKVSLRKASATGTVTVREAVTGGAGGILGNLDLGAAELSAYFAGPKRVGEGYTLVIEGVGVAVTQVEVDYGDY